MKYSNTNKPTQLFMTENECFKVNQKFTPKKIMVHSTSANNTKLSRYVGPDDGKLGVNKYNNHWNHFHPGGKDVGPHSYVDKNKDKKCDICGGRRVCVHAFIGKLKDGTVTTYQVLPWDVCGWHAGGSANNSHIGFEICEDDLKDVAYFKAVYQEAVELCAYLCKLYGLTERDIICHSEGHKLGIASNHGDVMHWFPKHGKSMDTFRADVAALLKGASASSENSTETPAKTTKKPDVIYQVYAGGKWWSEITNYNANNSNGYAGVMGKEISGIRVRLSNGKNVTIRSHISGNKKTDWLAPVTNWDQTSEGYSGWKGKPTDCIAMKAEGCTLKYRVHVKGGGWLGWISKSDINDYDNGLAGIYGKPIDAVQICVV